MKMIKSTHTLAFLILGLIAPLSAQNLESISNSSETAIRFGDGLVIPGNYQIPAMEKAQGVPATEKLAVVLQDTSTLITKVKEPRSLDSVVDLAVLRNPSPYRKMLVSAQAKPEGIAADGLQSSLARISAAYREVGNPEPSTNCQAVTLSVELRVKLDPSNALEIVEQEIGANPGCSCEIVKTAIITSEADVAQVVAIVEVAINASPESMRIISQCAIAVMPDSLAAVQALLAKIDPNAGESGYSSKGAKSAKSAKGGEAAVSPIRSVSADPLDRPDFPIVPPPPIIPPPPTTNVNP